LKKEQSNVTRAIASHGDSEALSEELTKIESERDQIRDQLSRMTNATSAALSYEDFKAFVGKKATELKSVLIGDPAMARQAIRRVTYRLFLTPVHTSSGPVFAVSGDIDLFAGDSAVLLGSTVYHSTKQYIPVLSLTGVQLDPNKPAEQRFTRSNKRKPPSTRGEMAPTDAEIVAV
jgi:hypothetical protein